MLGFSNELLAYETEITAELVSHKILNIKLMLGSLYQLWNNLLDHISKKWIQRKININFLSYLLDFGFLFIDALLQKVTIYEKKLFIQRY